MPNWCDNHLEIKGEPADIAAIAQLCGCHQKRFDFNAIVPMPAPLDITCGSSTDAGFEALCGEWEGVAAQLSPLGLKAVGAQKPASREELIALLEAHADTFSNVSLRAGRQAFENLQTYGAKTWYEWRVAHWGTKWNVDDAEGVTITARSLVMDLQTAWGPPVPALATLCARFPNVQLRLEYSDPGMNLYGTLIGRHGELVDWPDGEEIESM